MGRLFSDLTEDEFDEGILQTEEDLSGGSLAQPFIQSNNQSPGSPNRDDVDLTIPQGQPSGGSPGLDANRFGDLVRAGIRRESGTFNLAQMGILAAKDFEDQGFDPFVNPEDLRGFEAFPFHFAGVRSRGELEYKKAQLKQMMRDNELLMNSGGLGFAASLIGALLDPSTFVSPAKLKVLVGTVIGEETVRQAAQVNRQGEEAFLAVGATAILGGILRLAHTNRPTDFGPDPILGTREEVAAGQAEFLHPFNAFMREVREGELNMARAERGPAPEARAAQQSARSKTDKGVTDDARTFAEEGRLVDPDVPEPPARGVGAEAVDEAPGPTPREELEAETMLPAFGLEKLPDSPLKRTLQSGELRVRQVAQDLADNPFFMRRHERFGAGTASVETNMRAWWWPTVEQILEVDRLYHTYRGGRGVPKFKDRARRSVEDFKNGRGEALSPSEFRREVGKAMHLGDVHAVPEVAEAAGSVRKLLDRYKKQLMEDDVFARPLIKEVERLNASLAKKPSAANVRKLKANIKSLEADIERLRTEGPQPTNADSFFPVFYRHDLIMSDYDGFKEILRKHFRERGMRGQNLETAVEEMTQKILRHKPYTPIDEDAIGIAKSLRERTLDVPVRELFEFMETDVDAALRYYTRTISADLELTKRFGDITMGDQIAEIEANFSARLQVAKGKEAAELIKERDANLKDIRAMRDRLRGTFGLPDDPYRLTSRVIRNAKQFMYMTMLGGVVVSSLNDITRLIMTEGMARSFGAAFKPLVKNLAGLKLSAKEAKFASTGLEMELSLRAQAFSELGDTFGRHSGFERGLQSTSAMFSLINLFNPWNAAMKGMAASVVAARIGDVTMKLALGKTISKLDIQKLARANIDEVMAKRIGDQYSKFSEQFEDLLIANTEKWDDLGAVDAFRHALAQDVERAIVTPGIGDRPLWMSSELGSLIGQFKSFSMASAQRVMVPGLQQRDREVMMGIVAMTGLGMIIDEIKRRQFGFADRPSSLTERLVNGIDRSGVTGYFSDINRIVEKLSDNQLGLSSMLGIAPPFNPSFRTKVGSILGPTAGQMARVADILTDTLTGEYDYRTAGALRRLLPGQNVLWLKPGFDLVEEGLSF